MVLEIIPAADPIMGIPRVKTSYYGTLDAPKNFAQLTELLSDVAINYPDPRLWRGHANIEWQTHSTAVRRILNDLERIERGVLFTTATRLSLEQLVRKYETHLLNQAFAKGYGYKNGRKLSELELLACLQHYGGATRLLDFTRNVFVALWFACQSESDSYGLLIGTTTRMYRERYIELRDATLSGLPVVSIFEQFPTKTFIWEPLHLFERMRVQQSVFFFGPAYDGPWGSLSPNAFFDEAGFLTDFFAFAISPQLKREMWGYWQALFGFDVATLFPDIEGFGRYHSASSAFEADFFS